MVKLAQLPPPAPQAISRKGEQVPVSGYPPPQLGRLSLIWRYGLAGIDYVSAISSQLGTRVFKIYTDNQVVFDSFVVRPIGWVIVDIIVGAIALWIIRYRRRYPVPIVMGLISVNIFSTSCGVVTAWAYVSLCTRRRWREVIPLGLSWAMATTLYVMIWPPRQINLPGNWSFTERMVLATASVLFIAIYASIGLYVGARRDLFASLAETADSAERAQELGVLQAQEGERNRIAVEMQEVLTDRIALLNDYAEKLLDEELSPSKVTEVASLIQKNAHSSLNDLRGILSVLREESAPGALPEKPQPTMADIAGLIDAARAAGQRVEFSSQLDRPELLTGALGRHAYRIVQEGLTNARVHAPGCQVTCALSGSPGEGLMISMRNPVLNVQHFQPVPGVGLLGLEERARITGGELSHKLLPDKTFELRAWLPW